MRIELSRIPPDGLELDRSFPFSEIETNDLPEKLIGELHFKGRLDLTTSGLIISGKIRGEWQLQCSRCLENMTFPVSDSFRIFLTRTVADPKDASIDLEYENLDESDLTDDSVDLTAIIREQMVLHLPMKSLCREDCRGLCSDCGQNLNLAECSCKKTSVDPRMLKLKQFFEK